MKTDSVAYPAAPLWVSGIVVLSLAHGKTFLTFHWTVPLASFTFGPKVHYAWWSFSLTAPQREEETHNLDNHLPSTSAAAATESR